MEINEITEQIIGCTYDVGKILGCGFVEKVYENALVLEMSKKGLKIDQQYPIKVLYDDQVVGEFVADILVEKRVLVELKAVKEFDNIHFAQCMNYLKASSLKICLLINFGKPKIDIKRIVNTI
jgi:GxxExxY protein